METSHGASIRLEGVTKRYGDATVVDSIDLAIEPGEFMTLLGPSGSGKTTTLNMIAGFAAADAGSLSIGGRPVTQVPPHKRDIGMVFQNYALFPHRTVAENIAYPLQRRRVPKSEQRQRVAQALDTVRMAGYGDRYPAELSGGQQQRVALARALVYRPRVLLMDEPLGALDKQLRESLQTEIKRIHREVGSTFVYVTHDQDEALSMSDRIAVFNEGRIEQVGTAAELYESPRTLFAGRFLGESTLVPGELAGAGGAGETILIRPENLRLEPLDIRPAGREHALPVTVIDASYLGATQRYTVRLPDGSEGIVRRGREEPGFAAGAEANLVWSVDAGVRLAEV